MKLYRHYQAHARSENGSQPSLSVCEKLLNVRLDKLPGQEDGRRWFECRAFSAPSIAAGSLLPEMLPLFLGFSPAKCYMAKN
jgi:hypothetical protein